MSASTIPTRYTSKTPAKAAKFSATAAAPPTRCSDRNESRTVLRACEVLKAFRARGEDLRLNDVIERTRLPKTTVFRLLRTLIHGGLLERPGSGVYRNRFGPVTAQPFRVDGRRTRAIRPHYGQEPILCGRDTAQH